MTEVVAILGVILTMTNRPTPESRKKGVTVYRDNPFWEDTEVKIGTKMVRVAGGRHVDANGEAVGHSGIHVVRKVDKQEFVKLYTKNVKAIFDLRPTSQRVIEYLITELQKTPNADALYLPWIGAEEYFDETNVKVSRSSFQRALKELIEKGFIAESTRPSMFWFNPNLFFNGSRMTFISEYEVKSDKPADKPEGDSHLQESLPIT